MRKVTIWQVYVETYEFLKIDLIIIGIIMTQYSTSITYKLSLYFDLITHVFTESII